MLPEMPSIQKRSEAAELMDGPCPASDCARCLRDLSRVNRMLLAYRPTLSWLSRLAEENPGPLRILDAGCGFGDTLRRIETWANRRGIAVELTGIDCNPATVETARQASGAASKARWICADILADAPGDPVDVVVSSLLTHHLSDDQIVRFLQWMERTARLGWLINDLERSLVSYFGFKALAGVMRWHPFVRHDGPVSILRSFLSRDWEEYTSRAGLPPSQVTIFRRRPGRLCVSRMK